MTAKPPTRLMRVPIETYEAVAASAEEDRRFMNQQLAVLVAEALEARAAKARREAVRKANLPPLPGEDADAPHPPQRGRVRSKKATTSQSD